MCASAAVIPITSFTTALDTLLSVLVQRSNVHNCIPNSCQISRNRLICVFGIRDSGKITYSVVTWDKMK